VDVDMTVSAEQVLGASAEWISVWFPTHSVHVDLGWLEYYLLEGTATVMRIRPGAMTAAELVAKVLAELRSQQATKAHWQVGPRHSPTGVDQVLLSMGASVYETVDICAYPLDGPIPDDSLARGASARPVRTRDDVAQFERTSAMAWGYPPPSKDDLDKTLAGPTDGHFIGYWQEAPAGAGGYGLVGDVARFWGTAVVPEFRGRGVYRALVHARMTDAKARGARLALVHAREATSSPILQRLGFTVYGQRKVWSIDSAAA
jgi:GNAT superfamily N-acetyltransferase